MRKTFKKAAAFVLTAMLVAGTSLYSTDVYAGSSDVVIDNTSFAESLNSSVWSAPNSDIVVFGGKILFTEENTADTRLITKNAIVKSSQHEELFDAQITMKINQIPQDKRFVVAFSLANMESVIGEEESLALIFKNQGGTVMAGVSTFDADGNESVVTAAQSVGSSVSIKANATKDMQLTLSVNGKSLFQGEAPVDMTGRIGFLQDDTCLVEISQVNIVSHKYDTPENANVTEDFEKETINVNAFDSYMGNSCNYFPSGLRIEEYNGENVLMFRNVGMGWFGTTYKYSNFECTFDVPYILFQNVLREDGTVQRPASNGFIFTYGDLSDYFDTYEYENGADAIIFENTEVRNYKDYSKRKMINDLGIYDRDNNVGYSVKIRVEDTQFTLYMKPLESDDWQEILSYKIGNETPTGYIHIWSASCANFAIDNFTVTNLDEDANTIEVEYQGSKIEPGTDWEYEEMPVVYLDEKNDNAKEDGIWPIVLIGAAGAGAVIILGSLLIAKKRKKKGAENGEI